MTMPKLKPSGYYFRDDPKYFTMPGAGYSHEYPTNALGIVSLYSADQLTEAYEAGGRDATPEWQPIETAPRGVLEILLRSPNGKISNGYWGQECNRGKGAWVWPYVKSEPSHWMSLPAALKGEA